MLEFLDGTDLHNTIRLLLTSGTRKIIVVEGEDDFDLLVETFDHNEVAIVPGYGKAKTLEAALEAAQGGTEPVRFLLDADFDRITGAHEDYPANVIATLHYDLAMDTVEHLTSVVPRIARLASGQVEPAKLSVEEQVALAYSIAEDFGAVRLASHMDAWNLSFDAFPFHLFLPASGSEAVDMPPVVALLVSRTRVCELNPDALCARISERRGAVDHVRALVNGHDLFDILLHVGRRFGGARSNTGYETQFKLAAAGSMSGVPVVKQLIDWVSAA